MRFSRNWIAAYTDLPAAGELHELMSMLGLVVDDARPNGDDETLDLDFPSNRPDAMNHLGVAREISIRTRQALREPAADFPVAADLHTKDLATVAVTDSACGRFVARAAVDVHVGPSPQWLCERLESIGLRPINNVVDITNFVMWELGRPMHAYDLDRLADSALVVRRAVAGEHLVTLDEIDRELGPDDLVIADTERVVGLAGVMGGTDSGVSETTTRVLLECAFFDAATVRSMAKRHSMHTDASHRFERGLSVQDLERAVARACALLHEHAQATITGTGIDVVQPTPPPATLTLRTAKLSGMLGVDVAEDEVRRILAAQGCDVDITPDGYAVRVPPRRVDIHRDVDLVEEVARFHGYDRLPGTLPLLRRRSGGGLQPTLRDEMRLREAATGLGFWEAITFVFSSHAEQDAFADGVYLELTNPLSEAFAVMRRNLTPSLLAAAGRNRSVGEANVRLFEVGRTYARADDDTVSERRRLALLITGDVAPAHWESAPREATFSDIKGAVETLWCRMGWPPLTWSSCQIKGYQPGAAAEISCNGSVIGVAGKVAEAAAGSVDIAAAVWTAEVDIEDFAGGKAAAHQLRPLPRYPASERDISLLVNGDTPYSGVAGALAAAGEIPLVDHRLLSRYEGDDLAAGTSVWTLRLTYRSSERTLTTEEIEAAHEAAVASLVEGLDARRR